MTIEIHNPELEALIRQRMESGAFDDVEDVLIEALKSTPEPPVLPLKPRRNLVDILSEPPFRARTSISRDRETIPGPLGCERISGRYQRHLRVHQTATGSSCHRLARHRGHAGSVCCRRSGRQEQSRLTDYTRTAPSGDSAAGPKPDPT